MHIDRTRLDALPTQAPNAQQQFVALDACAAYSTVTDEQAYPDNDDWHYDSAGYLAMGVDFADLAAGLVETCATPSDQASM